MGRRSYIQRDGQLVFGHRGSAATHPENTLASFRAALDAGADGVEADLRLTADGVPVVLHDADVSRTTQGQGLLHELTLAEVRALDAGDGERVPTLDEVLELAADRDAVLALEIKNLPGDPGYDPAHEGAVDALIAALGDYAGLPVLVVSFNPRSIERARRSKTVETGFLATAAMDPGVALRYAKEAEHDWVWPHVGAVTSAGVGLVEAAHATGIRLGTWTVDEASDLARLLDWGVDAVVSNDPATAVGVREGRG